MASTGEPHFLICVRRGLWGTEGLPLRNWFPDDMLAFIIDKKIAGLAKVTGKCFYAEDPVWSNGLFPHRIPIEFICVLDISDRLPMQGLILEAIMGAWGRQYGWGLVNKKVLPEDVGQLLVNEILSRPNALSRVGDRPLQGTDGQSSPDLKASRPSD